MAERSLACPVCGTQFVASNPQRKYCSRSCKDKRSRRRPARILGITYTCLWCGADYHPKRKENRSACSRECGFKVKDEIIRLKRTRGRVSVSVRRARCRGCSSWFNPSGTQLYCSDGCRPAPLSAPSQLKAEAECRECGGKYAPTSSGGAPSPFCSDMCREEKARRTRRTQRIRRKAMLRAAKVEAVDPITVFNRDGWRCNACGQKTPKEKRGTIDPNAPELDHIVPLSKGGEHSYRNTQCLCRACNAEKSDGAGGQLLLFG